MRARILLALALLVAAVGLGRADDKPLERTELDKRVVATVYEVALRGTKMFNDDKNYEGCYRIYEGALMALVPMLDHRQKLQATVKLRLDRAAENLKAGKWKVPDAAFELRTALDEIQNEIAPPKDKKPDDKKAATLWDRLGGDKGVRKVVDDIVATAAEDKKVNFFRDGKVKLDAKAVDHLKQMLVELISANSGGPLKYTGKTMKDAHKDMMITDAEFDALRDVIVGVLKKHKVSEEDIAALGKIVESTRKDIVEVPKK